MLDLYRQEQIDSIKAVQWRAARFTKRDYKRIASVKEMLQSLHLDLLEDRRKAHRLNILYLALIIRLHCLYLITFLPKKGFARSFSNDSFIQANYNHDYYFIVAIQGQ